MRCHAAAAQAGSTIIIMSSGAAIQGSLLRRGYGGSATLRMLARFLNEELRSRNVGIRFHALWPGLTPETDLAIGRSAAR